MQMLLRSCQTMTEEEWQKYQQEQEEMKQEWNEMLEFSFILDFIQEPDIKPQWEAYVAELKIKGKWPE